MLELLLLRTGDQLTVALGEQSVEIPLAELVSSASNWQRIYDDAVTYGRELFDQTFRDEQMRTLLTNLSSNERLVLVAEDPLLASIPWECPRDQNDKLLAARLNFVRGIPQERRRDSFTLAGPLEIVAIPVSPVDEPRVLNTEREWRDLVEAVTATSPLKSLTLKRVRPPTRNQMERSLGRQGTPIVHFMGHSASRDGKARLALEDARARPHLVDVADFSDSLNTHVFLVVLNSCLSAFVSSTESGTVTEIGNIARTLVRQGFPYTLGMQFEVPDNAALVLSRALYNFLLQEQSVEEAVMLSNLIPSNWRTPAISLPYRQQNILLAVATRSARR